MGLVVARQTAVVHQPAEGPLDHPAPCPQAGPTSPSSCSRRGGSRPGRARGDAQMSKSTASHLPPSACPSLSCAPRTAAGTFSCRAPYPAAPVTQSVWQTR